MGLRVSFAVYQLVRGGVVALTLALTGIVQAQSVTGVYVGTVSGGGGSETSTELGIDGETMEVEITYDDSVAGVQAEDFLGNPITGLFEYTDALTTVTITIGARQWTLSQTAGQQNLLQLGNDVAFGATNRDYFQAFLTGFSGPDFSELAAVDPRATDFSASINFADTLPQPSPDGFSDSASLPPTPLATLLFSEQDRILLSWDTSTDPETGQSFKIVGRNFVLQGGPGIGPGPTLAVPALPVAFGLAAVLGVVGVARARRAAVAGKGCE